MPMCAFIHAQGIKAEVVVAALLGGTHPRVAFAAAALGRRWRGDEGGIHRIVTAAASPGLPPFAKPASITPRHKPVRGFDDELLVVYPGDVQALA